jgi:hypothetical protein
LNVWELFEGIYLGLVTRFPRRTLLFTPPAGAIAEVADDSDGHRTRIGVMAYKEVSIITMGQKKFLIGVGHPHGYPADGYASDLLVLPLEVKIPDEDWEKTVLSLISESTYFKHTMLVGLRDGLVAVPREGIYAKYAARYFANIFDAVAEEPRYSRHATHGDGTAVALQTMQFRHESVTFFVDGCTAVLAASL